MHAHNKRKKTERGKPEQIKMKKCKKCDEDAAKISKKVKFSSGELEKCPGETRDSNKCDHGSFRACVKLLDSGGEPLVFGDGLNWWQWSKNTDIQWDQAMRDAGGSHWCVCTLCIAEAVKRFGCDKVHFDCGATDGVFVMAAPFIDPVYAPLASCLKKKCPSIAASPPRLYSLRDEHGYAAVGKLDRFPGNLTFLVCVGIACAALVAVLSLQCGKAEAAEAAGDMEGEHPVE